MSLAKFSSFGRVARASLGICAVLVLFLILPAQAARVGVPPSFQWELLPGTNVDQVVVPAVDPAAELETDNKNPEPFPRRYAVARPVTITPALQGTWEPVTNGRVWRVRIDCAGA